MSVLFWNILEVNDDNCVWKFMNWSLFVRKTQNFENFLLIFCSITMNPSLDGSFGPSQLFRSTYVKRWSQLLLPREWNLAMRILWVLNAECDFMFVLPCGIVVFLLINFDLSKCILICRCKLCPMYSGVLHHSSCLLVGLLRKSPVAMLDMLELLTGYSCLQS